jgi:hypothetical protein
LSKLCNSSLIRYHAWKIIRLPRGCDQVVSNHTHTMAHPPSNSGPSDQSGYFDHSHHETSIGNYTNLGQHASQGGVINNINQYYSQSMLGTQYERISFLNLVVPGSPTPRVESIQHAKDRKLCPLPVPSFTGRNEILEKMKKYFDSDVEFQRVFVLHGLGGSGKSQIAFKFLQESQANKRYGKS